VRARGADPWQDTVEGIYAGCGFEVPYRDIIEKGRWKMVKDGLSF